MDVSWNGFEIVVAVGKNQPPVATDDAAAFDWDWIKVVWYSATGFCA